MATEHTFPARWSNLRVNLAHDWLTGMRGGERVLEILAEGFPAAPIHALFHCRGKVSPTIERHPIHTSWLQQVPGIFAHYRGLLPLFPAAARSLRLPPCDLLLSTSHCVAKSFCRPVGARHLCYCFTPMRYAWLFQEEYLGKGSLRALAARPLLAALRRWDAERSVEVDRFVAISRHVQDRIRRFYGRESDVVYPPVDTDRFTPAAGPHKGYDLIVSALVPYKRVDLAVAAYTALGYPLKVVGTGSGHDRLRAVAGPNVEFLGWQSDEANLELYRGCRQLIFPGEEDFGIVPLEAQACGRPVVAFRRGGATETVVDGETGIFFDTQDLDSLVLAVEQCAARTWDPARIRANAERFAVPLFIDGLARSIEACMSAKGG